MNVRAQRPPQGRVQQVRRGVIALGRVARAPVHMRAYALPGLERAALGRDRDDLIVSEPQDVLHDRPAVAVGALHISGIGHLATAGGVERRLDQLHQHASVVGSTAPTVVSRSVIS